METVILDAATLGSDLEFSMFNKFGDVTVYQQTAADEVAERVKSCDIIIVNKVKLGAYNLNDVKNLKIICITATGFDNVDLEYCGKRGIAVCNVKGYSTNSVAQLTAAMALSLANNLSQFDSFVKSGKYTEDGVPNCLTPVFHELSGKTWGIVGLGGIGRKTAEIAKALGCRVIAFKRTSDDEYKCVGLDELCKTADIISVHLPLSDATRGIISKNEIALMKKTAIVINVARGAVIDEEEITQAVIENRIGGLGIDVYNGEPMSAESPYRRLLDKSNVILTPHMAWGAYEARVRCMEEIVLNIEAFLAGEKRNRVDKIS